MLQIIAFKVKRKERVVQQTSYSEFPERSRDISWVHVTITQ